jgi:hypothetical protein
MRAMRTQLGVKACDTKVRQPKGARLPRRRLLMRIIDATSPHRCNFYPAALAGFDRLLFAATATGYFNAG